MIGCLLEVAKVLLVSSEQVIVLLCVCQGVFMWLLVCCGWFLACAKLPAIIWVMCCCQEVAVGGSWCCYVVAGAFGVFFVLMYGFQSVDMRLILLLFGC